jgi:catechol 2,3-dioxygenase-like lactoylglutathione lyase family enzyme
MIYSLPVGSATDVILDGYPKSVSPRGTGPHLMFTTSDIANARLHIQGVSHSVSDVKDIGSSLVIYFEDPDGNLLCIRQPKSLE